MGSEATEAYNDSLQVANALFFPFNFSFHLVIPCKSEALDLVFNIAFLEWSTNLFV